ncbi:hypothetical protein N5B55_00035 [Ralstonia pickettii]|uniref:hypothetical protein n=1 Tax=Ralstonia pickettii TaxID=329 RepID=UPI002714A60E|nr:hypothetical protein [Ralstonia pickettii]WKZ85380.1 hypothetical protein N5B55_00035 [Ralstonia pickettii]
MQLRFRCLRDDEMDRPPTQRDQFNNDDVELADALVRETLQNSLDAGADGETVRVRFAMYQPSQSDCHVLSKCLDLEQLTMRLRECSLMPESLDLAKSKLLVIEDFGTTGLTGSWNSMDEEPFCDFWRRMGKSHKGGKSLGRWGLGKLVFSSTSQIRAFFGLTVREDDPKQALLMGQAVLTTHSLNGERFDSHGFYCALGESGMQLPITDSAEINELARACGLIRTTEPGLSIAIPCALASVTEQRIIQATLRNYFFPILLGKLVVTVGSVTINAESFAALAKVHGGPRFVSGELAQFISAMRAVRTGDAAPHYLPANWASLGMKAALGESIDTLRGRYQADECLCVRAPLLLKRKDGKEIETYFDLFLQRTGADSDTLFVRDAIVLPAEARYFGGHHVLAALVADHKPISEFLGDAENPAHTSWSASAEKLTAGWRNAAAHLKEIRYALRQLYGEIVSSLEQVDENALINFFSASADAGVRGTKSRGPVVRPIHPNPPPPKQKAYRLKRLNGGFSIQGDRSLHPDELPLVIRIRAAYDVLRGNAFSKHDPLDFDFSKNELQVVSKDATVNAQTPNILVVTANSPEFEVSVTGFDGKRDLIVDASRQ